jgi:hypothetical protein
MEEEEILFAILVFILVSFLGFLLLFSKKEPKEISLPLNISLWGKQISCKNFHAVLNISGERGNYYLKKVGVVIPGVETEYKILDMPLNETMTIDYEVPNMDRLPCNSILELIFYEHLNTSYFKYYVTGY